MKNSIDKLIEPSFFNRLEESRKFLHAHPEISGQESNTAAFITTYLDTLSPDHLIGAIGGHGIVAIFEGAAPGPHILFRAELDALPIKEINDFPHKSQKEGQSHKCGHDGHMTILLGLAQLFSTHRPEKGKVSLLFQPAEETGAGAAEVMKDERFKALKPDFVFALHNLPGHPKHQIVVKSGAFTASVKSLIIRFFGKTAHAAEPEKGINPAFAISELITRIINLSNNDAETDNFALITPVHIQLGTPDYGISAGYAEVRLTIRTWTSDGMNQLGNALLTEIHDIARENKLEYETTWTHVFRANKNDEEALQAVQKAAEMAGFDLFEKTYPFKWGEDFGLFTQQYKGAMFGLGAGEDTPALHNPDYDFPDELIRTGVTMFFNIARQYTSK